MSVESITKSEICDAINEAFGRMTLEQRRVWEVIKVPPQKWALEPYGNGSDGFWVVAIIGSAVIWFNDIEEGFNRSTFVELGKINDYFCNQDKLEWQVQNLINLIRDGYDSSNYRGAPEPSA